MGGRVAHRRRRGRLPSQVTFYFGSKEALFVEVASRELLRLGTRAKAAAASATTPPRLRGRAGLNGKPRPRARAYDQGPEPGPPPLRPALGASPHVRAAAFRERDAYARLRTRRRWSGEGDARAEAERFWASVLGVSLRRAGVGRGCDGDPDEMLRVINMSPPAKI